MESITSITLIVTKFIIPIANSVLSGIIVDLVREKKKAALKADIELEVNRKVREEFKKRETQSQEQELQQEVIRKTLEEIKNLVNKDLGLKFSSGNIELEKPVKKPILPFIDRDVDKEVEVRLERLEKIIAQRRKELGLPPESKEENLKDNLTDWEPVENLQLEQSREETLTESQSPEATVRWEPIAKQETQIQDRDVDQEVEIRLERVKEIIAQRRKELGLPSESKEKR